MRLLLDEQLSPEIARQLRSRGHDVVAVVERPDLIGQSDRELWERMGAEQRAIVTNDVPDYLRLFHEATAAGREHFGLVLTDDRRMPRSRRGIGSFVVALDRLLQAQPAVAALRNQLHWLQPSTGARRA